MIERVQVQANGCPGQREDERQPHTVGAVRRLTFVVAVAYTGFVFAYLGQWPSWSPVATVWWFTAGAAITAAPLLTSSIHTFRTASRIEAGVVFAVGAAFFFVGSFLLFAALVPLLTAAARSRRADTVTALICAVIGPAGATVLLLASS